MRISVIGCGYLGATHAACMADLGHEVIGIDVDPAKIAKLNAGEQAAATNGVCRLGESALLQGCASRLKCGEPPSERRCLCFGGPRNCGRE